MVDAHCGTNGVPSARTTTGPSAKKDMEKLPDNDAEEVGLPRGEEARSAWRTALAGQALVTREGVWTVAQLRAEEWPGFIRALAVWLDDEQGSDTFRAWAR